MVYFCYNFRYLFVTDGSGTIVVIDATHGGDITKLTCGHPTESLTISKITKKTFNLHVAVKKSATCVWVNTYSVEFGKICDGSPTNAFEIICRGGVPYRVALCVTAGGEHIVVGSCKRDEDDSFGNQEGPGDLQLWTLCPVTVTILCIKRCLSY